MLTKTAVLVLLALNACSGRYEIGGEDTSGDSSSDDDAAGAGTTAATSGGGGRANGPAHFGGSAGSTLPAEGGSAPSIAGGMPGSAAPECDWPAPLIPEPELRPAPPDVVWRRLTRFLLDQELDPDAALPAMTTPDWAEATALRLLGEYPDAPVFQLLLENSSLNSRTSALYGTRLLEPGATLRDLIAPAESSDPARIGFLTDPDFLAQYESISGRGMYMANALFCVGVPPEPPDTLGPRDLPGMTRRAQIEQEASSAACTACHRFIDPLGFALENFDALGDYRTIDDGFPVDTSGNYTTLGGAAFSYSGIHELAPQLAASCEVARCITRRLLVDALTRGLPLESEQARSVADDASVTALARSFLDTDRTVRSLVREIVTSPLFLE